MDEQVGETDGVQQVAVDQFCQFRYDMRTVEPASVFTNAAWMAQVNFDARAFGLSSAPKEPSTTLFRALTWALRASVLVPEGLVGNVKPAGGAATEPHLRNCQKGGLRARCLRGQVGRLSCVGKCKNVTDPKQNEWWLQRLSEIEFASYLQNAWFMFSEPKGLGPFHAGRDAVETLTRPCRGRDLYSRGTPRGTLFSAGLPRLRARRGRQQVTLLHTLGLQHLVDLSASHHKNMDVRAYTLRTKGASWGAVWRSSRALSDALRHHYGRQAT